MLLVPANQYRGIPSLMLHFGHVNHLIQRWRDQTAQPNNVHLLALAASRFFGGHHHAQINNFIIVAGQHNAYNVFALMSCNIAFYGGYQNFAAGFQQHALTLFSSKTVRDKPQIFHHARVFTTCGKNIFPARTNHPLNVHTGHQRPSITCNGRPYLTRAFPCLDQ